MSTSGNETSPTKTAAERAAYYRGIWQMAGFSTIPPYALCLTFIFITNVPTFVAVIMLILGTLFLTGSLVYHRRMNKLLPPDQRE